VGRSLTLARFAFMMGLPNFSIKDCAMKSVTEFASFTLKAGLTAKTALAGEGKTPEEVQAGLGEKFKYEGDKLKHFGHALDVAEKNPENLKRVLVVSYAEGENPQPKALKVEEHHYLPEFHIEQKKVHEKKSDGKGGRGGGGKGRGGSGGKGEKESPWGLSPEQKAAKKGGGAKPK
jgi:hypothetical protein